MSFRVVRLDQAPVDIRPPRPLYFVSDLHLGDGGPADDFAEGRHREAFQWFLAHEVRANGGHLVLVGDVLELWQCKLERITRHYAPMLWQLAGSTLIRGNHDARRPWPRAWRWPGVGGPAILAEHGHRADLWNSKLGLVGRVVTWVAGALEFLGWRDVDDDCSAHPWGRFRRLTREWKWRRLPRPTTHPERLPPDHYARYAGKRARETGARLIILGHTHRPELRRLPTGALYANCGSWVGEREAGSWVVVSDGLASLLGVA